MWNQIIQYIEELLAIRASISQFARFGRGEFGVARFGLPLTGAGCSGLVGWGEQVEPGFWLHAWRYHVKGLGLASTTDNYTRQYAGHRPCSGLGAARSPRQDLRPTACGARGHNVAALRAVTAFHAWAPRRPSCGTSDRTEERRRQWKSMGRRRYTRRIRWRTGPTQRRRPWWGGYQARKAESESWTGGGAAITWRSGVYTSLDRRNLPVTYSYWS